MTNEEITQESNPTLWEKLRQQWITEKRPGWVVTGSLTYQVIQKTDGDLAFIPYTGEQLYDTTSF